MKNILTIPLLVFLTGCSGTGYNDWTEKDQTKYKYFIGLQAVDTLQTIKALKCRRDYYPSTPCLEEANPIFGKNPSEGTLIRAKLLSNLLIYVALRGETDLMSRETSLNIMNTATTLVVINNQVQINKVF